MPSIKPGRVLGDLYKLRTFGTYKTGVRRPTFSPDDIAARDGSPSNAPRPGSIPLSTASAIFSAEQGAGAKALSGSHIESQNHAGWLDGALGCVYALEASRALREAGGAPASTSSCSATRKAISARSSGRVVHRPAHRGGHRQGDATRHDGTPLREALPRPAMPDSPA